MFDRLVTLARRQRNVIDSDIVLEVNKAFGTRVGRCDLPQGQQRARCDCVNHGRFGFAADRQAGTLRCRHTLRMSVRQCRVQREMAPGSPSGENRCDCRFRHKSRQTRIETQLATGLREQVHSRAPAARHADQITGNTACGAAAAAKRRNINGANMVTPIGHGDRTCGVDSHPGSTSLYHQAASEGRLRPRVHHLHRGAGLLQGQRAAVGRIVVGEHHRN